MQLRRNEILTGLLVLGTVAVLTFILIMLGAPGLFRPLVIYKLYFDNAAGIKLGAPVLLAGRKVGQVKSLNSPVSREEAAGALEAAGNLGTVTGPGGTGLASLPRFEVRIDIEVDRTALVYKNANVRLDDPGFVGRDGHRYLRRQRSFRQSGSRAGLRRHPRARFLGSDREVAWHRRARRDRSDRDLEDLANALRPI